MPKAVILDPPQEASLDRLIAAAGVTLPLRYEDRLATMREAWREGVESGNYEPLDATLDALEARYSALEKAGP